MIDLKTGGNQPPNTECEGKKHYKMKLRSYGFLTFLHFHYCHGMLHEFQQMQLQDELTRQPIKNCNATTGNSPRKKKTVTCVECSNHPLI